MAKVNDKVYGSGDEAKAAARRFAARGNELGWKVVAGKLHDGDGTYTWRVAFMADPDTVQADGARFEPVAAYASKALGKLPKQNPVRKAGNPKLKTKFYVLLGAVPNEDFAGHGGHWGEHLSTVNIRPDWSPVSSLEHAVERVEKFIQRYELGGGNFVGGDVVDLKKKPVAWISYNGRVWDRPYDDPGRQEIIVPQANPAYGPGDHPWRVAVWGGEWGPGSKEYPFRTESEAASFASKHPTSQVWRWGDGWELVTGPTYQQLCVAAAKRNPAGLPPSVERYAQETREQNPDMPEPKVWAIAWSRYCKYKAPESGHCRLGRADYFPGRGGKGSEEAMKKNPAQIIPFPKLSSLPVDVRIDAATGLMDALLNRFGSQIDVVLVEPRTELAVAFEPWTVVVLPNEGAQMSTMTELAALGVTVTEDGGFVPTDALQIVRNAIERPAAPPPKRPIAQIPEDFDDIYRMFTAVIKRQTPGVSIRKGKGTVYGHAQLWSKGDEFTVADRAVLKDLLRSDHGRTNWIPVPPAEQRECLRRWAAEGMALPTVEKPKRKSPRKPAESGRRFALAGVTPEFEAAFDTFMLHSQAVVERHYKKSFPSLSIPQLLVQDGKRYVRISRRDYPDAQSGSAHAFVDKTNGNILKPASWKAPAKHARGNILAMDYEKWMGPSGPAYLR